LGAVTGLAGHCRDEVEVRVVVQDSEPSPGESPAASATVGWRCLEVEVAADIDRVAKRPSNTAGQCGGARRECVDSSTRNWRQQLVVDAEHAIRRFGPSVAGDEQKFVLAGGRTDETVVERAAGQAYFG
jgi:hypothetical protein